MSSGEAGKSNPGPATIPLHVACAVLTAVLLLCFAGVAFYAHSRHGLDGVVAAAVGAGVCWAGAIIALFLAAMMQGASGAVNGVLLGMLFRMGLPLAAALYFHRQAGPLAEAGIFGMILCYYFVTLVAETLLALRIVGPANSASAKKVSEAS